MIRRSLIYFLLVVPALVYVVILSFIPAATVVFDSFQTPSEHYVLTNYIAISNAGLGNSILDTLFVSIGALLLQLVIAIFIANIMSKPFRGNKAFSVATIIPFGVSTIVAGFIFSIIFSAVGGFANSFLHLFGLHQVDWYQNSIYEMAVVIFSDYWKNTPLVALVIFSGLTSLSPIMFESAKVDGAGSLSRFRHIMLPNLLPSITVALLIRGVSEFNIFALPLVLIGYHPSLINTLVYEFYSSSSTIYYSYAAATVLLVIILAYAGVLIWKGGVGKNAA